MWKCCHIGILSLSVLCAVPAVSSDEVVGRIAVVVQAEREVVLSREEVAQTYFTNAVGFTEDQQRNSLHCHVIQQFVCNRSIDTTHEEHQRRTLHYHFCFYTGADEEDSPP